MRQDPASKYIWLVLNSAKYLHLQQSKTFKLYDNFCSRHLLLNLQYYIQYHCQLVFFVYYIQLFMTRSALSYISSDMSFVMFS